MSHLSKSSDSSYRTVPVHMLPKTLRVVNEITPIQEAAMRSSAAVAAIALTAGVMLSVRYSVGIEA